MASTSAGRHREAAAAFGARAREELGDRIERVVLFGSVARGEERGIDSDVDLLVVVTDDTSPTVEQQLQDIAGDVMLEYGVAVSAHLVHSSTAERSDGDRFVRNAMAEGVDV